MASFDIGKSEPHLTVTIHPRELDPPTSSGSPSRVRDSHTIRFVRGSTSTTDRQVKVKRDGNDSAALLGTSSFTLTATAPQRDFPVLPHDDDLDYTFDVEAELSGSAGEPEPPHRPLTGHIKVVKGN